MKRVREAAGIFQNLLLFDFYEYQGKYIDMIHIIIVKDDMNELYLRNEVDLLSSKH